MAEIKGLLKSFKTEINPTEEQKAKIRKTVGTCRIFTTSISLITKSFMIKAKSL